MKFCWLIFFLSTFAFSLPAQITNPPPASPVLPPPRPDPFSDPLIQQIEARQRKAVDGDTAETKKLAADLEKWTAQQPQNHLLQAYLGSVYTLCSRDAWPGPGKLTYLRNGGRLLDAAVLADPGNPAVRFVRAIDYFELPAIFGKRQVARDDFQILLKQVDGEIKSPYALNTDTIQAVYYYAGLSLKQQWLDPQAKDVWERGWSLAPASPLGVKIQDELAKLK
jgi:hypothetical protein